MKKKNSSRPSKRKRKRSRKIVIQRHHITYDPPWVVTIYKGEHYILTLLQRRTKHVSKGFITALKQWIKENEAKAIEL